MIINDIIRKYEGYSDKAYKCPKGIWTIGYGSTYWPDGTPVKQGDTCYIGQAQAMLDYHLSKEVDPYIKGCFTTPDQQMALRSLVFNWGGPVFAKSKLKAAILAKDMAGIYREWDVIGTPPLLGLIRRRLCELNLWFGV